jgi:hypothetical protein
MKAIWPTIDLSSPSIIRQARRYELKLRRALAIAARRDSRKDPRLAALYAGAQVEGVDSKLRTKRGVVTFTAPPFRGGLHQIYDWPILDENSVRELAESLAWSLRESLRRAR